MFDKKEIGTRIRNARNAKGWTLEELAERANTSYQNISKLEKNGTSDLTWINPLSEILGTNLQVDTIDVDGSVSEIGKEILYQLITHSGRCEMFELEEHYMYGLSENQITNEIVKLAKIGLVVREKYMYYDEEEIDEVFITAKGIITIKNMQLNISQSLAIEAAFKPEVEENEYGQEVENWDKVTRSYEYIISPFNSYEEVIQNHKNNDIERTLRELKLGSDNNPYRIFFLNYLKEKYEDGYNNNIPWLNIPWKLCNNAYETIISRMIYGLSDNFIVKLLDEHKTHLKRDEIMQRYMDSINPLYDGLEIGYDGGIEQLAYLRAYEDDTLMPRYEELLGETFSDYIVPEFEDNINEYAKKFGFKTDDLGLIFNVNYQTILQNITDSTEKEFFELLKEVWDNFGPDAKLNPQLLDTDAIFDISKIFDLLEGRGCSYPSKIFSKEEIELFIKNSFKPAETEYELELDMQFKNMAKIKPEILEYFSFPKNWEENGLAELVRKNSGLF